MDVEGQNFGSEKKNHHVIFLKRTCLKAVLVANIVQVAVVVVAKGNPVRSLQTVKIEII